MNEEKTNEEREARKKAEREWAEFIGEPEPITTEVILESIVHSKELSYIGVGYNV